MPARAVWEGEPRVLHGANLVDLLNLLFENVISFLFSAVIQKVQNSFLHFVL